MFQPDLEIEHHDRLLRVRSLRRSGLTYREIAEAIGISAARLSQLRPQVDKLPHCLPLTPMNEVRRDTDLARLPLSRRTRFILAASDFETVDDLLRAHGATLKPEMLPGCDPRSWREISAFLGAMRATAD